MPQFSQLLFGRLSSSRTVLRTTNSTQRTYTTSTPAPPVKNPLQRRKGSDLGSHLPKNVIPTDAYIPPYPYGAHQLYKQANKGLYGEQRIQFGNNVSEKTETKTRRKWKPNVLSKGLYSVALKKKIKLRITAKVLKTMDREGGLDEYLLKDDEHRIKELGPMGWALRWTLIQRPEVITRLRADAAALGVDQATIDKQWPTPEVMAEQKAAQSADENEPQTEGFEETEDQQIWEPVEHDSPPSRLNATEGKVYKDAALEYEMSVGAAQRYISRGYVDSEEEGLKLAFVRAKDRLEAASRLKENFVNKLKEQFSNADLQGVRLQFNLPNIDDDRARRIAYNQWRRQEIEKAGSQEAWRESRDAGRIAARKVMTDEAGGEEVWLAAQKSKFQQLIKEAETASNNRKLNVEQRQFLETALIKADRAIQARASDMTGSGKKIYADVAVEEFRQSQAPKSGQPSLKQLYTASKEDKNASGDAWGALVNSSNPPVDRRSEA